MEIKPDTIEAVIREALIKYDNGRAKYGPLSLDTGRDFLQEAEAELLDCINYCVFQILRLRGAKRRLINPLTKDLRKEAIERFLKG